jgi:Ca2+-binding RTX toxin-like protein
MNATVIFGSRIGRCLLLAFGVTVFLALAGSAAPSSTSDGSCMSLDGTERHATINGTPGNDVLVGTPGPDVIAGNGGDDTIDGGGGNDVICGGDGNDHLLGGPGNDDLSGDAGNDTIDGGETSQFASDFVIYSSAPGPVNVNLTLGVATGWGTDTITGVEGISGSSYADTLTGGPTDDEIFGQAGNDKIDGGGGDDFLSGSKGDDVIVGGAGEDTANYWSAPLGVTANLATGRAVAPAWGTDRLSGIEDLDGSNSDFADHLTGNGGANYLRGFRGPDVMAGGGGPDILEGGNGNDKLDGGRGTDIGDGGSGKDVCRRIERKRHCEQRR